MGSQAEAQNFEWAIPMGDLSEETIAGIATDEVGNVCYAGTFDSPQIDVDPGPGIHLLTRTGTTPNKDAFIVKLGPDQSFIWAMHLGGTGDEAIHSIITDAFSHVIVTGRFSSIIDFDPGPNVRNLDPASGSGFVLRMHGQGYYQWAKNLDCTLLSAAVDQHHAIWCTGSFSNTVDFNPGTATSMLTASGPTDAFVLKFHPLGHFILAKRLGGDGADEGRAISIDVNENVYTTGRFQDSADFDPGPGISTLTANGNSSASAFYISKLDVAGNFLWARGVGPITDSTDQVNTLAADTSGVYLAGAFRGTLDLDPSSGVTNLTSTPNGGAETDGFIAKLRPTGSFLWAMPLSGGHSDQVADLALDEEGKLYATGYFSGFNTDFDPDTAQSLLSTSTETSTDPFVLLIKPTGSFFSVRQFTGNSLGYGTSIAIDHNHNILSAGTFLGTKDFDPRSGTYPLSSNTPGALPDVYLSKLSPCTAPGIPVLVSPQTAVCSGSMASFQANPVEDADYFQWTVSPGTTLISGQNTSSILVRFGSDSGKVAVKAVNHCGEGEEVAQALLVNAKPTPSIASFPSPIVCEGTIVTLSGPAQYANSWSGEIENGFPFKAIRSQKYSLTSLDSSGCSDTTSLFLTVYPTPAPVFIALDSLLTDFNQSYTYCVSGLVGSSFLFQVQGGQKTDSTNRCTAIEWQPGQRVRSLSVTETTKEGQCQATADQLITYKPGIQIPTLITPNGDNQNDAFIVHDLEFYSAHHLQVFDRWGKKVLDTYAYEQDWKGDGGIYFYTLEVDGRAFTGWVSVLK